jgi:hypothetical protein
MKKLLVFLLCVCLYRNGMGQCVPNAHAFLDVNNVMAPIVNDGTMGNKHNPNAHYTVDTGNGAFAASMAVGLWVGGFDADDELHLAAMRFGQSGNDYFSGPLNTTTAQTDPISCAAYNRMWKLDKWKVEEFVARLGQPGYVIPQEILDWPAHGDISQGFGYNLAPYYDADSSGNYDPLEGDYPYYNLDPLETEAARSFRLNGDQSIWWVMNDAGGSHTESGGEAIGLEIRCVAYALDRCDALGNVTFHHYEVINRGSSTLHDTRMALWADPDAGFAQDDYAQCDVGRNLGYVYDANSGTGNGTAFGIDLLQGPYRDSNGLDDDNNGIVDDERHGMNKFIIEGLGQELVSPPAFYNNMRGMWADGSSVCYGGNGHQTTGCNGTNADFMFPGNSDPSGIGTGGVAQQGWTEQLVGNAPGERRFIMSSGPFTLEPGAINRLHYAVVWANDADGTNPMAAMEEVDDLVQAAFDGGFANLPCCPPTARIHLNQPSANQFLFSSITTGDAYFWDFGDGTTSTERFPYTHSYSDGLEHTVTLIVTNDCGADTAYIDAGDLFSGVEEHDALGFQVYPNPGTEQFNVAFNELGVKGSLEVKNMLGQSVYKAALTGEAVHGIATNWPAGNYLLLLTTQSYVHTKRLSVVR